MLEPFKENLGKSGASFHELQRHHSSSVRPWNAKLGDHLRPNKTGIGFVKGPSLMFGLQGASSQAPPLWREIPAEVAPQTELS